MDPKLITPFLISAVVMWAVYRRVRRNFGRQPIAVGRMQFRIGLLSLVGVVMLVFAARDLALAGALLGGIVFGAGLGYFGLQHTQFEATPEGKFFTPHTYVGLFVTALFLGRLAYRFLTVLPAMHAAHQVDENPFDAYQKSPLTLAIFGVLIGYYVVLYVGVLRRSRGLALPSSGSSS
jgi:hypothetical protein